MVIKYALDNGLTVLLEPIPGVVSISAGLWLKVGSRNELEPEYGFAHFTEHMLFKGTPRYSARELARVVDRVGGQHNAATNREYTCYYINVVSDYLELAVDILADMYHNPLLDKDELEKEKNVIIEEIRMYEDTPDEFIHDFFIENMLIGHPLSHSILGSRESIQNATRDSLVAYYDKHYTDDRAIFVISGNFDEAQARDMIARYFVKRRTAHVVLPAQTKLTARRELVKHEERDLEQVYFCLGTEGVDRDDESRWALYALSTVLGGSMSSRLFQNIREKEGISYSIYTFHSSYSDQGVFGISCATSPDTCERALQLILKECRDLMNTGVTREELEDTRTYMIGNLALSLESVEVRMGQLAKNEIAYGRYFSFEEIVEKINNISLDDFHRISDRIFKNKKLSLISVGDISTVKLDKLDFQL